jgi:hypothetical protein
MKELKEARMDMIALAAVMLVSVMGRLMRVRIFSSGMMTLVVGRDRAVCGMKARFATPRDQRAAKNRSDREITKSPLFMITSYIFTKTL